MLPIVIIIQSKIDELMLQKSFINTVYVQSVGTKRPITYQDTILFDKLSSELSILTFELSQFIELQNKASQNLSSRKILSLDTNRLLSFYKTKRSKFFKLEDKNNKGYPYLNENKNEFFIIQEELILLKNELNKREHLSIIKWVLNA